MLQCTVLKRFIKVKNPLIRFQLFYRNDLFMGHWIGLNGHPIIVLHQYSSLFALFLFLFAYRLILSSSNPNSRYYLKVCFRKPIQIGKFREKKKKKKCNKEKTTPKAIRLSKDYVRCFWRRSMSQMNRQQHSIWSSIFNRCYTGSRLLVCMMQNAKNGIISTVWKRFANVKNKAKRRRRRRRGRGKDILNWVCPSANA